MENQEGSLIEEKLVEIPTSKADTVSELMRGGIIYHIEQASTAQISRQNNMIRLRGNPQEIECAEHLLMLAMNENIMELKYKTISVPTREVGTIIGKKHQRVKAIKHASAANINFEKKVAGAPSNETTSIRIIGMHQEQIDYAEEYIRNAMNGSLHFEAVGRNQDIDEGKAMDLLGEVYKEVLAQQ